MERRPARFDHVLKLKHLAITRVAQAQHPFRAERLEQSDLPGQHAAPGKHQGGAGDARFGMAQSGYQTNAHGWFASWRGNARRDRIGAFTSDVQACARRFYPRKRTVQRVSVGRREPERD
jgi:hypothetical protein